MQDSGQFMTDNDARQDKIKVWSYLEAIQEDERLGRIESLIMYTLYSMADKKSETPSAFPSVKTIARRSKCGQSSVFEKLPILVDMGWLRVTQRIGQNGQTSSLYFIGLPEKFHLVGYGDFPVFERHETHKTNVTALHGMETSPPRNGDQPSTEWRPCPPEAGDIINSLNQFKNNQTTINQGDSDFLDSSHPKNKTQEACKDQKDDSGKEDSFKTSPVIPQELSSVNDSHTSSHTPPIPKDSLPNLKHSPKALNQFTEPQGTAPKQSLEKPLPQFRPTPSPDILFLQKVKAEYVKKSITNDGELFHLLSMAKKKVSEDEIIAIIQRHKESVNKTDAQENGYRFIPSIQKFFLEDGEWNNWIDKRPATQKPFKDWTPEEIEHFRANVLFKKPKKLTYED